MLDSAQPRNLQGASFLEVLKPLGIRNERRGSASL